MKENKNRNNNIIIFFAIIVLGLVLLFNSSKINLSYLVNDNIDINITGQIDDTFNAWNNTLTGVNGESNIVDTKNYPHISIITQSSGATTLSVSVSPDGVNFGLCEDLTTKINTPIGFTSHIFFTAGARYFKLISSNNVRINATISAKP